MNGQATIWILGIIFVVLLAATFMLGVAPGAIQPAVAEAHVGLIVLP